MRVSMSIQISITVNGEKIEVRGPYSESNNQDYRSLGGKWSQDHWSIPDTDTARAKIVELFGERGEDTDVIIPVDKCTSYGSIVQFFGYVLASRRSRDSRVEMPHGVSLHAGEFRSSGGSVKHPRVALDDNVVFRCTVRKPFAALHGLETPIAAPEAERLTV